MALIALVVVIGFLALSRLFVSPKLVEDRAHSVLSLIRSHEGNILLSKTRDLRDELLKSGLIQDDNEFHHYFQDERATVQAALKKCSFITPVICIGSGASVFLASGATDDPASNFKFAVMLSSDLSQAPRILLLWEGVVIAAAALALFFLFQTISAKEKYLLSRLQRAGTAFREVGFLLSESKPHADEFDVFGKSVEELIRGFKEYKEKFERKTRLEQLGLTVGQVSHDLKAPLNEAENFLNSLPLLLETASKEQLQEAIKSLVKRIRSGKEALSQALQFTKQVTVAKEELKLRDILEGVSARAKGNAKLQSLSLGLSTVGDFCTLGDRLRLETALLNLLENTAEEKENACVELTLSRADAGYAKITYQDNGGGIPEEFLEKVFEPLVTFKLTGTGLGLSSTKEILAQHGGQIKALPSRTGAKFEILLPVMGGAHA